MKPGTTALLGATLLAVAEAAAAWPRVIDHPLGQTTLPAEPERIVAMSTAQHVDSLIALGKPPVGAMTYGLAPGDDPDAYPPAIAEQAVAADITAVGSPGGVDLEAVAVLEPDLIISSAWRGRELYESLSRIAPTITTSRARYFPIRLREIARAVGREERAERVVARYREHAARVRERVGGREVAIVRPRLQSVWMYGPPSDAGRILADAGIAVQPVPDDASITSDAPGAIGELSLERLPVIDAPRLFVILYNLRHHEGLEGYLNGPMWPRLPAVQAGNVHPVEGIAWTNHGPLGARRMLDQAAAALTDGER